MLAAAIVAALLRDTIEPLAGCYRAAARLDDGRAALRHLRRCRALARPDGEFRQGLGRG